MSAIFSERVKNESENDQKQVKVSDWQANKMHVMEDRHLKQQILQSDMDNSFTGTGTFGKQGQTQNGYPSNSECERGRSNLAKYKNGDVSADNLVKIESSPEPSQKKQGYTKINS